MMVVHNCDQGSADWFKVRAGIPTASMFATVVAAGKGAAESKTRRTYMLKLAGEIITGQPMDSFSNGHMERGKEMEDEARQRYAFERDAEPELIGFISNGSKGASPDSLLAGDGLLEIKTKLAHLHIDCLLRDTFPSEHVAQCQGQLWVAEREWIDLAVYWPGLPLIVKRAHRDEHYITAMSAAVDQFNDELAEVVEKVRRYSAPPVEAAA